MELEKGYADIVSGDVRSAEAVFGDIRKDYCFFILFDLRILIPYLTYYLLLAKNPIRNFGRGKSEDVKRTEQSNRCRKCRRSVYFVQQLQKIASTIGNGKEQESMQNQVNDPYSLRLICITPLTWRNTVCIFKGSGKVELVVIADCSAYFSDREMCFF